MRDHPLEWAGITTVSPIADHGTKYSQIFERWDVSRGHIFAEEYYVRNAWSKALLAAAAETGYGAFSIPASSS